MNVTGKFLLAFLCISIASYGLSGSVSASSHNLLPLTVQTNTDSYASGDLILIFGSIKDYDGGNPTVTIQVSDPKENRVHLCQVVPESDGTFDCTTTASARWTSGEYNVKAMWNYQPAYATFEFVGGAAPEPVNDAAAELSLIHI